MKAALVAAFLALPAPAPACGVALALIIDVSGSVNEAEYALQTGGLADALLDPTVLDALVAEQAALTLIEWSGGRQQQVMIPWTKITDARALAGFAIAARASERSYWASFTAIGAALQFTGDYFAQAPACDRRVIDVSGDGPTNDGLLAELARARLVGQGFTINGIAIEGAMFDVTGYYNTNVIGGFGAFVLTAESYADYPRAIRRKLINEVTRPGS